jgi:Fe-S oxidoreductase
MKKVAKKKPSKQDLLEANNLIEEVSEIFEKCIHCGICKGVCPAFKVILEERVSPRGHAISGMEKMLTKAVYECTLCGACDKACHMNIKITDGILKAREALFLKGKGLE